MNREARHHQRSLIVDRLSYIQLHAPDFPEEDHTSLEGQKEALMAELAEYERRFPSAKEHPRYALFRAELSDAFAALSDLKQKDGVTKIETALHRFRETFRRPPAHADSIAGPSGIVKL